MKLAPGSSCASWCSGKLLQRFLDAQADMQQLLTDGSCWEAADRMEPAIVLDCIERWLVSLSAGLSVSLTAQCWSVAVIITRSPGPSAVSQPLVLDSAGVVLPGLQLLCYEATPECCLCLAACASSACSIPAWPPSCSALLCDSVRCCAVLCCAGRGSSCVDPMMSPGMVGRCLPEGICSAAAHRVLR